VAQNWPGLTLSDDTVYVISGTPQEVYLLEAETGVVKATFTPSGERRGLLWWSPVTVAEDAAGLGLAFVGFSEPQSKLYRLYAFDAETGQERWHLPADDLLLAAPTYGDGVVYFGASDGQLYAADLETQTIKAGWPFKAQEAIWGSPLLVENRLYVASMDHRLYCLDAETGQLIWDFEAGGALAVQPALDAVRGTLYVGSFDGHLYAVQAESGQAVAGFDFKAENWIWSEVLLGDEQLFATALDGKLYALDPVTGAVLSPYPYDSSEVAGQPDRIRAAPARAGDRVLVATELGRLIAVENAQRLWHWPSGAPETSLLTTPVASGDRVFIVSTDGQVQTLDTESGTQLWSFVPPQPQ
jgi:outer membrane protein assembly factor BamB